MMVKLTLALLSQYLTLSSANLYSKAESYFWTLSFSYYLYYKEPIRNSFIAKFLKIRSVVKKQRGMLVIYFILHCDCFYYHKCPLSSLWSCNSIAQKLLMENNPLWIDFSFWVSWTLFFMELNSYILLLKLSLPLWVLTIQFSALQFSELNTDLPLWPFQMCILRL